MEQSKGQVMRRRLNTFSSVVVIMALLILAGCSGRGPISGAVPTMTADSLFGKPASEVIEVLGPPDGVGENELYYGSEFYFRTPTTATTKIIGNTAYTTVYPGGTVGGTCLWTFYLNEEDIVIRWDKRGTDCATLY